VGSIQTIGARQGCQVAFRVCCSAAPVQTGAVAMAASRSGGAGPVSESIDRIYKDEEKIINYQGKKKIL